jgi:hypothetical protein
MLTNTTGGVNTAVGQSSLRLNTTGNYNTALGDSSLYSNTTASNNTAVGYQAAYSNTTRGAITAVGYQALYTNTTDGDACVAVGYRALFANTTGNYSTAVGFAALDANTTGGSNSALGLNALGANTTGGFNTAIGHDALVFNTTASNNTAVGYQAGYSNTTGTQNLFVGRQAGYSCTTVNSNTFVGDFSGYSTTGRANTFLGQGAGNAITSGFKNTIIGVYDGNTGGLDIRTANNYIVLSDGDGNPRIYWDANGTFNATANAGDVAGNIFNANAVSPYGLRIKFTAASPNSAGNYFQECRDGGNTLRYQLYSNGGIANYSANNSNLSDQREKKDIELAGNYLDKVCAIPVKTFLYNDQTDTDLNLGVIAQDVQAVAPELVMESNWGTEEEPKMRLSIYQTDLQYALMKAIQELNAKVEAQALEIATLRGN